MSYFVVITDVPTSSYAITEEDNGRVLRFWSDEPTTVYLNRGLPQGLYVEWIQQGRGQVTFVAGDDAYVQSAFGCRSAGRWASGRVVCVNEVGYWNVNGGTTWDSFEETQAMWEAMVAPTRLDQKPLEPVEEAAPADEPVTRRNLIPSLLERAVAWLRGLLRR